VRSSRFSFPTFPRLTRKDGAPGYLAGVRLSWLGVQDRAQNSHGQCWWCGQTRGPSTSYSGSLCEPEYCAQDDNVKRGYREMRTTEADPRLGLSRWALQSREAFGSILYQKWMACARRDSRFPPFRTERGKDGAPPSWRGEIQRHKVPRTALAMTDCLGPHERGHSRLHWSVGLVQRSFVGSRVCATPLPQDDSGRLRRSAPALPPRSARAMTLDPALVGVQNSRSLGSARDDKSCWMAGWGTRPAWPMVSTEYIH
jgi:hypothetical protein